jgi:hypothetical protein
MALYIFYESALGLSLFEVEGFEEIQQNVKIIVNNT